MNRTFALLSLLPLLAMTASPAYTQDKGKKTPPPTQQPPAKKPDAKPADKKPAEAAHKATGVGSEVDAAISLNDAAGKAHTFKDYRGKIVVIDFWSMDAASEAYSKRMAGMADELGKKGVAFLAIDPSQADLTGSDADAGKKIEEYAQKNGITFPVLLDKGGVVARKLGAKTMPEVLVLDAKGIVRYSGAIDDDPKGEKADKATHHLRSALEAVLAGKEVANATTAPTGTPIQHEKTEKPPEPPAKGHSAPAGQPPKH
jgi:peroxiredoxin